MKSILTISLGMLFAAVLISSQAFHWYRIQEMFHFDSFHMYGLLGSAILTGVISVWCIKKWKISNVNGEEIRTNKKNIRPVGNSIGGLLFGLGWGITGACSAPVFILVGWKWQIGLISILGVLLGTLIFGALKNKLPK